MSAQALRHFPNHTPRPEAVRRFPPVLQILVPVPVEIQQKLQQVVQYSFSRGKTLDMICWDVYNAALALGYHATIGVQEVSSTSMPSFRGQTVISALLLVDLQPVEEVLPDLPQEGISTFLLNP